MRDDFTSIVSHDLLNLLNAMVGISSLIEKELLRRTMSSAWWRMRGGCNDPVRGCVDSSETSLTSRASKRVCSR